MTSSITALRTHLHRTYNTSALKLNGGLFVAGQKKEQVLQRDLQEYDITETSKGLAKGLLWRLPGSPEGFDYDRSNGIRTKQYRPLPLTYNNCLASLHRRNWTVLDTQSIVAPCTPAEYHSLHHPDSTLHLGDYHTGYASWLLLDIELPENASPTVLSRHTYLVSSKHPNRYRLFFRTTTPRYTTSQMLELLQFLGSAISTSLTTAQPVDPALSLHGISLPTLALACARGDAERFMVEGGGNKEVW